MGANGAVWESAISPALRSSSSARKATACSTRERPEPRRRSRSRGVAGGRRGSARGTARRAESGAPCARATRSAAAPPTLRARGRARTAPAARDGARARRERCGPEAEVALALGVDAFAEPDRGVLHAPVLGEPAGQLLGGLLGLELSELGSLVREEVPRLDLQQRRDQDEELAACVEVDLVAVGQALDERDDDLRHVDLGRLEASLRRSVRRRSNGPSNASRSSSRSRTALATGGT